MATGTVWAFCSNAFTSGEWSAVLVMHLNLHVTAQLGVVSQSHIVVAPRANALPCGQHLSSFPAKPKPFCLYVL